MLPATNHGTRRSVFIPLRFRTSRELTIPSLPYQYPNKLCCCEQKQWRWLERENPRAMGLPWWE